MLKKIKEYFKNTDRLQIQQDFYALLFIAAGSIFCNLSDGNDCGVA